MHADAHHLLAPAGPPSPDRGIITLADITERKRAADALAHLLVALKTDIHWLHDRLAELPARDGDAARALRERMRCTCHNMGRLVGHAADSLGQLIADSRPNLLDHQDLWAALREQAHDFARTAQLELEWDMQAEGAPELPRPAGMAVLKVFQEMLSNVGRHAQASRLSVRIAVDRERLRLTVEDNGSGASPDAFEAGGTYGVTTMRERARDFGGHIAISSEVGHGCAFTLVLPNPQGAIA
jgi:signal transduction histidine kinase